MKEQEFKELKDSIEEIDFDSIDGIEFNDGYILGLKDYGVITNNQYWILEAILTKQEKTL